MHVANLVMSILIAVFTYKLIYKQKSADGNGFEALGWVLLSWIILDSAFVYFELILYNPDIAIHN